MFKPVQIQAELSKERKRIRSSEDLLLLQANKLLLDEQLHERNILNNLKSYKKSFGLLNEEGLSQDLIYNVREIRNICVRYRLRFLDSQVFAGEFPYEVVLKIKDLNEEQRKDLIAFKILTTADNIKDPAQNESALLFCQTIYGNYYIIHRWGKPLSAQRKLQGFPLRNGESFMFCILFITALLTLMIPNKYLSTDIHARDDYFSMYRIAAFFHLLILMAAFAVFYLFGRKKTFSSSDWDEPKV